LARQGIIQKLAAPIRLAKKSQVALEEPAYFYNSEPSRLQSNLPIINR
jgi:hypothetical protein